MAIGGPFNQGLVVPGLGKASQPLSDSIASEQIGNVRQVAWTQAATDGELDRFIEFEVLPAFLDSFLR